MHYTHMLILLVFPGYLLYSWMILKIFFHSNMITFSMVLILIAVELYAYLKLDDLIFPAIKSKGLT